MLIDARQLAVTGEPSFDLCVIGAGAAGITIARALRGSGLRIAVLEGGGLDFDPASQSLYEGTNVGMPYEPLDTSRLRYFGGSTNHWNGSCAPLSEFDFEAHDWIPNSGWPIRRSDLDPFYERAQALCQLGPFQYGWKFWTGVRGTQPVAGDDPLIATAIGQASPPTRFGEAYRDDLARAPDVTVALNANVVEIVPNADVTGIDHVRVVDGDGKAFSLRARRFVLAAGGIESARLMLASNSVATKGLGNGNDVVGRYFMDHPVLEGLIIYMAPDMPDMSFYETEDYKRVDGISYGQLAYFELTPEAMTEARVRNVRCPVNHLSRYLASDGPAALDRMRLAARHGTLTDDPLGDLSAIVADADMILEGASRKFLGRPMLPSATKKTVMSFPSMVDIPPNPESRVTLKEERDPLGMPRASLRLVIDEDARNSIWRSFEIVGEQLAKHGVGRPRLLRERDVLFWSDQYGWGSHHMGTLRMADDPKRGVVDADCRVHGLANLYVAGSSVFATGGHVPPTLTIVALALRLADHLRTHGDGA